MKKIHDTRIVICDRCTGEGTIVVATGGEDRCKIVKCPQCNGARVLLRIVDIEYRQVDVNSKEIILDK